MEPPRVPLFCPCLTSWGTSTLSLPLLPLDDPQGGDDEGGLPPNRHQSPLYYHPQLFAQLVGQLDHVSKILFQSLSSNRERERENKAYNDHEFILYDIFLQYDTNVKLQIAVADAYIIVCRTLLGLLVEFKHQIIPGLL